MSWLGCQLDTAVQPVTGLWSYHFTSVVLISTLSQTGAQLTVGQDIKTLLAVREVLDRLLDGRKISQVDVQELQAAIGVWVSLLDLFNSRVCFTLRASSYVNSTVVLVEDLA
jgi:hypothetical protein